ncbi:MAG: hypothetical protein U9R43_14530 [Thermodesulfobacteriota bacterium]|nr:hypothetical protein [Thermodesulfobacteriota bacterium]
MQKEIVLDIKQIFENELVGITTVNISLENSPIGYVPEMFCPAKLFWIWA